MAELRLRLAQLKSLQLGKIRTENRQTDRQTDEAIHSVATQLKIFACILQFNFNNNIGNLHGGFFLDQI